MNKAIFSAAAVMLAIALAGCGTISGMGKDVSAVGDWFIKGSDHYEQAVKDNPPGSKMEK